MSLVNLGNRINLKEALILLVEGNSQGMEILTQILLGFGANRFLKASTFEEAKRLLESSPVDLVICESGAAHDEGRDGYDFVQWLRRSNLEPNAYVPVIVASAHTTLRNVARARDCGAHFIVKKPLVPGVLMDRIVWIARENRNFVNCRAYAGPDRRFKNEGPPGAVGRRSTDLSPEVGLPSGANMSQSEIDNLMQPQRAAV